MHFWHVSYCFYLNPSIWFWSIILATGRAPPSKCNLFVVPNGQFSTSNQDLKISRTWNYSTSSASLHFYTHIHTGEGVAHISPILGIQARKIYKFKGQVWGWPEGDILLALARSSAWEKSLGVTRCTYLQWPYYKHSISPLMVGKGQTTY